MNLSRPLLKVIYEHLCMLSLRKRLHVTSFISIKYIASNCRSLLVMRLVSPCIMRPINTVVVFSICAFWLSSFNFNNTQCLVAFLWRNSLQVTSWLHLNCINSVGSSSHRKTVEADHHSNRCFSTRHFASRHSSSILKRDACVFRLLICDKLYAMLPHAL